MRLNKNMKLYMHKYIIIIYVLKISIIIILIVQSGDYKTLTVVINKIMCTLKKNIYI